MDVLLACGFGAVLCVNVVLGSCVNRSCENFAWMRCWHAGLEPCCVEIVFGVAVPIGAAKILCGCVAGMRVWSLAVCKLRSG